MQEKTQLEVGDIVYEWTKYHGYIRHTIERVTAKQAFYNNGIDKCQRELNKNNFNNNLSAIGIGSNNVTLETEELKQTYSIQVKRVNASNLLYATSKINVSKLTENQLNIATDLLTQLLELK